MINALHLLWIVPLSAAVGFVLAALCSAASRLDEEKEEYR